MLHRVLTAVHDIRPPLSPLARAIVEAVCLAEGAIGSADDVARAVGLPSRFGLARLLRREGLPSLRRIVDWARLLAWVTAAERDAWSLSRTASHLGRYPGSCYRSVKALTGLRWLDVLERGSEWVERALLCELRHTPPSRTRRYRSRPRVVSSFAPITTA